MYKFIKEILELGYFVSGPILAILAWKALAQIKISKIGIKREAAASAVEYINKYGDSILPKIYEAHSRVSKIINVERVELDDYVIEEMLNNQERRAKFVLSVNKLGVTGEWTNLTNIANQLEAFAVAFVKGIADSEIAFQPISQSFCGFVEGNYFIYCFHRKRGSDFNIYENTIILYKNWKSILKKSDLKQLKENIESELKEIDNSIIKIIE